MVELSSNKPATIIEPLICDSLGYCCPAFFFDRYRSPTLIAARLGVSVKTAQHWINKHKTGKLTCARRDTCMIPIYNEYLKQSHAVGDQ